MPTVREFVEKIKPRPILIFLGISAPRKCGRACGSDADTPIERQKQQ